MKKNLTVRYCVVQFSYWAAAMGAASFVTTYLLGKGLSSGLIGVLLAATGILVCLTQPFMASYADRSPKYILPQLILLLSGLCILCFVLQLIPGSIQLELHLIRSTACFPILVVCIRKLSTQPLLFSSQLFQLVGTA